MEPVRSLLVSGVVVAIIVAGCGNTTSSRRTHYSAAKFRHCLVKHHLDVTVGPRGEVVVTRPSYREWVLFFGSARRAAREQSALKHSDSPQKRFRILKELLRGRRANALVFAPATKDWRSPLDLCLKP